MSSQFHSVLHAVDVKHAELLRAHQASVVSLLALAYALGARERLEAMPARMKVPGGLADRERPGVEARLQEARAEVENGIERMEVCVVQLQVALLPLVNYSLFPPAASAQVQRAQAQAEQALVGVSTAVARLASSFNAFLAGQLDMDSLKELWLKGLTQENQSSTSDDLAAAMSGL